MDKEFLFSVIIPVYNVKDYIEAAVNSLIKQTIGFDDNIQVILVDDGSTDGSSVICERFAKSNPDNIIYIRKENGGVSSARNEGMRHVDGRYVTFLDGDDYWESNSFEYVANYFNNNPDMRIVSCRMVLFGKNVSSSHHLDYKYDKDKIIDITREYDYPENSVSHLFIERGILSDREFDERLRFSEDLLFINKILLREKKYAVLSSAKYMYRRRESGDSAINRSITQSDFYKETIDIAYQGLIEASKGIYGEVIPYVQYLLITDLQWRLNRAVPESIDKKTIDYYLIKIKNILNEIEVPIIIDQRRMSFIFKAYILLAKETFGYNQSVTETDWRLLLEKKYRPEVRMLGVEKSTLHIEVRTIDKLVELGWNLIVENEKNEVFKPNYYPLRHLDFKGVFPEIHLKGGLLTFDLPAYVGAKYSFILKNGEETIKRIPKYGQFSRLVNIQNTYFCEGNYIVKSIHGKICVYKNTLKTRLASRNRYEKELKERGMERAISLRRRAERIKSKNKPIWIISDRTNRAGDNGEALFSFLMEHNINSIYDIYFLLDENSSDFNRLKKIGPVIKAGSNEHLIMQMAASLILSSSADAWVLNPYKADFKYYRDLLSFKYVFLQHGITQNDLSGWLNRFGKNIKLFITAAKPEYKSILNSEYGYDEAVVKLVGFARYDRLSDQKNKIVSFLPTWRREISGDVIPGTATREYSPHFKDSNYCMFYNQLINDERILGAMKRRGYKGNFYPHPSNSAQYVDFKGNDTIKVLSTPDSYAQLFKESALLITDYSSVAMDFAYLKKPVIYTQFDKDEFYRNQWERGYFDYERDGFGPVCYDYESTVEAIVQKIEDECIEEIKYIKRIEDFFAYTDRDNCKRIYSELKKMI